VQNVRNGPIHIVVMKQGIPQIAYFLRKMLKTDFWPLAMPKLDFRDFLIK
jgi:hypothetical protein